MLKVFVIQFYWQLMSRIQSKSLSQSAKNQQKINQSTVKTAQKLPSISNQTPSHDLRKSDMLWANDKSYFRRKLNEGMEMDRSVMLSKSRRTNQDNPEQTMCNSDFYRRELHQSEKKDARPRENTFDVLNNPKRTTFGRNEDHYYSTIARENSSSSSKDAPMRKTLTHLLKFQPQIAAKIGATTTRDYTIPRPQLKIGSKFCIDTYSPF